MTNKVSNEELLERFTVLCTESVTINEVYQKNKHIPIKKIIDNWSFSNKISFCKLLNVTEDKKDRNTYYDNIKNDNSALILKKVLTIL